MGNDPVNWIDPDGLGKISAIKKALKKVHEILGGGIHGRGRGKGKFGSPERRSGKRGIDWIRGIQMPKIPMKLDRI